MKVKGWKVRTVGLPVLLAVLILAAGPVHARDPFVTPAPSMDAFNYPAAAGQIQLKGLVRTGKSARAVLYLGKDDPLVVVKPSDEVIVKLEGLRHKFRVRTMQDRTVVLAGDNGEIFEIGVVERTESKR